MIPSAHMLTRGWRRGLNDDVRRLTGLGGLSFLPTVTRSRPTAFRLLPTAFCPLPTANFLLLTAYCLVPTAYCLLLAAYCSGRILAAAGCAVMVSQSARTRSHSWMNRP